MKIKFENATEFYKSISEYFDKFIAGKSYEWRCTIAEKSGHLNFFINNNNKQMTIEIQNVEKKNKPSKENTF